MDFNDETVFDKEQCIDILKKATEEVLGKQIYTQNLTGQWISNICEKCTKKLVALNKPFKYVVTCVIMQRNGAGLHTACSCFWDSANDGSCSYRLEDKSMYCIVTCFALAI
mmetsp:Transcript_88471/g.235354  ORF Transcript_88471/g.235354 Transcript_88471/m.235354 type:complete len:111 (-) Transcript_88471:5000-5332(-)